MVLARINAIRYNPKLALFNDAQLSLFLYESQAFLLVFDGISMILADIDVNFVFESVMRQFNTVDCLLGLHQTKDGLALWNRCTTFYATHQTQ